MSHRILTSVLAVVVLSTLTAGQPRKPQTGPEDSIVLDSEALELTLNLQDNQLRLVGIAGPEKHNRLTRFTAGSGSLWKLKCIDAEHRTVVGRKREEFVRVLTDSDASQATMKKQTEESVEIVWTVPWEKDQVTVTVTIDLPKGESLSRWRIAAKMPAGLSLESVEFPVIANVDQQQMRLAWPTAWGWECDLDILQRRIPGKYPGSFMVMQFFALYRMNHGLYYAAHDREGYFKIFEAFSNDDVTATTQCEHMLAWQDISKPYEWKLPYDMILGVYDGGYYEGAQIYRDFCKTTPWWDRAKKAFDNAPEYLKKIDMVMQPDHHDDSMQVMVDRELKLKEYMDGAEHMLWWWHWNGGMHDYGKKPGEVRKRPWHFYPNMYPPVTGWKEGLKTLHDNGLVTMPYCDPLRVVITEENFGPEGWYRASVKHPDGKTYFRRRTAHGKNMQYCVPCPGDASFSNLTWKYLVKPMVTTYGSGGMYLDELGAAWPKLCYDPDHGHPLGGGNWWSKGIVRLIQTLRKLSPKTIWMTENNPDCYMGEFDLFLMLSVKVNHIRAGIRRTIPLFPIVWGGRYYPVGQQLQLTPEAHKHPLMFKAAAAESLLWGAKLGGLHSGFLMRPENVGALKFFRKLVRCRRTAHQYVQNGRCLGMLEVTGDVPVLITSDYNGVRAKMADNLTYRAVMAAGWQAEDGSLGVVLANIDDKPHTVRIPIPAKRAGLDAKTKWHVEPLDYIDAPAVKINTPANGMLELTLPPRTPLVVRCQNTTLPS